MMRVINKYAGHLHPQEEWARGEILMATLFLVWIPPCFWLAGTIASQWQ